MNYKVRMRGSALRWQEIDDVENASAAAWEFGRRIRSFKERFGLAPEWFSVEVQSKPTAPLHYFEVAP